MQGAYLGPSFAQHAIETRLADCGAVTEPLNEAGLTLCRRASTNTKIRTTGPRLKSWKRPKKPCLGGETGTKANISPASSPFLPIGTPNNSKRVA